MVSWLSNWDELSRGPLRVLWSWSRCRGTWKVLWSRPPDHQDNEDNDVNDDDDDDDDEEEEEEEESLMMAWICFLWLLIVNNADLYDDGEDEDDDLYDDGDDEGDDVDVDDEEKNLLPLTVDCERCNSDVCLPPHQLTDHPWAIVVGKFFSLFSFFLLVSILHQG